MPYQPVTNFDDSNGVDLGQKLVTKDYLLTVYGSILDSLGNSGLTVTPALWTWGLNDNGQLGINDIVNKSTPITTILGGINWRTISCGSFFTSAIKTDGTLWVWGGNDRGQLGINVTTNRSTPVTTILGGTNWKSVSCGGYHISAIKTDGTLWVWGRNTNGQLGNFVTTNRSIPVTTILGGTNWQLSSNGFSHTASIKTDGTLWLWGGGGVNNFGQLGNNATTDRSIPITTILGGTNWKSISCGGYHTASIKTDGTLWTWGSNLYGQLGINSGADRSIPVTTVLGGTNWKYVSISLHNTSSTKTDGTLWLCGRNNNGQLGINDTNTRSVPVTTILGGTNWKLSAGGATYTSSIKTDGSLWTWGNNFAGKLGVNNTNTRSIPVTTILGGTNWKLVSCSSVGGDHQAAILSNATI